MITDVCHRISLSKEHVTVVLKPGPNFPILSADAKSFIQKNHVKLVVSGFVFSPKVHETLGL